MKKCLMLLLIICAISCAPNRNDYKGDYRISPRMECYFQVLLKRWYDGADGQGQGPVGDSRVLGLVERHKNTGTTPLEMLKVYEKLLQYPGLGIFDAADFRFFNIRYDIPAQEVLKTHYNIDVDLCDIKMWNTIVERHQPPTYRAHTLVYVNVPGYEDEYVIILVSRITGEVLSIYRGKKGQMCR